jgi:hypothetical protein
MRNRLFVGVALPLLAWSGFALAQSNTVLGPSMTTVTANGVAAIMNALPANPSRKRLTICNGHASNTATFTTGSTLTPVSVTTGIVLLGGNVSTSCFTMGADSATGSTGVSVGAQINVIASTAATPITFLEYY